MSGPTTNTARGRWASICGKVTLGRARCPRRSLVLDGQTISHYQVLTRLGGGGMGVVYRARDLRLDRLVALKVLPPELTRDAEAKARFMQEAKAASGLDHPNICTVHDIDEAPDGQLFLVLAYYPGETLKQTIARGPLPLDTALDLATQIAQGLQKAHAAGIVHRDIKPANVMVTPEGVAKIVDFGLAKLVDATGLTRPGTTLGTVAYMSPEQTRGEAVDVRSDLWALGVVLYEMVAGQVPFGGDSAGAIAAAIQQQTPAPLTALRSGVPLELDRVVARALARDRTERFQTAADLAAELRRLRRSSDPQVVGSAPTAGNESRAGRSRRAAWALAGIVMTGAVVAALLWPRGTSAPSVPRFVNPVQVTNAIGMEDYPSWSPDGQTLTYAATQSADLISGNWDIWVVHVGGGPPVNRTADHAGDDRYPAWSPDGKQIAFWSSREGGGYFVMPALGGAPRRVIATPNTRGDAGMSGFGVAGRPAWSPDGTELAGTVLSRASYDLTVTSLSSQQSRHRRLPPELVGVMDLSWSPAGQNMAFVEAMPSRTTSRLYSVRLGEDGVTAITDGSTSVWSPTWSPDGRHLYFVHSGAGTMDLWHQAMTSAGHPEGLPAALTTGVEMRRAALTRDGRRLAYSKGRRVGNVWRVPIRPDRPARWADAEQLTFDQAFVEYIDVTRDGSRLLVSSDRGGNSDVWSLPASGGEMRQVTTAPTQDWNPRWSPDGTHVAFYADRTGRREIWVQPVTGGPASHVSSVDTDAYWPTWSLDGRRIAFSTRDALNLRTWFVAATGGEAQELAIGGNGAMQEWSPDGRWLTFLSSRSGVDAVWRVPAAGGTPVMLGGNPVYTHRWSPDGQRIYLAGTAERAGAIWEMAADGTRERPVTDLRGRRGYLEPLSLATDGMYLYFTWGEDLSDIWVMDVLRD
jgi:eukaryotic-like serine/threonine-protein kinase